MLEWLLVSEFPLRVNLDLENAKILFELLKLHSSQWLRQHISYLFVCRNILELHFSSMHHIHDIAELDLDVLRLVVEHKIFQQLHATRDQISHVQLEIK